MDVLFKSPWGTRVSRPVAAGRLVDGTLGRGLPRRLAGAAAQRRRRVRRAGRDLGLSRRGGPGSLAVPGRATPGRRWRPGCSRCRCGLSASSPWTGPVLRLAETVTNESAADLEVMWSHHPAFGAPFLEAAACCPQAAAACSPTTRRPGTLLAPGSRHAWPHATTAAGDPLDLRRIPGPGEPRAVLAYLGDFTSGYFAITNPRLRLGVGLRWPLDVVRPRVALAGGDVRRGLALVSAGLRRRGGARGHDPRPRHARRPRPGPGRASASRAARPGRWSWRRCCSRRPPRWPASARAAGSSWPDRDDQTRTTAREAGAGPAGNSRERRRTRMAGSYARFTGKTGMVTGAGMGIGAAIARALAAEGAAVAVVDRDAAAAEAGQRRDHRGRRPRHRGRRAA